MRELLEVNTGREVILEKNEREQMAGLLYYADATMLMGKMDEKSGSL